MRADAPSTAGYRPSLLRNLNGGGHCNHLQSMVMVNRDITKAGALLASVNRLMEAGALRQPSPLMLINGGG